jgi:hypothetical protein
MEIDLPALDGLVTLAQAAGEPTIDGPFVLRIVSRMFHILCAIIIGGGLFYMRTILSPSGADACFADRRSTWARWVGAATFLLIATGLLNYILNIRDAKALGSPLPQTYHMLFGLKFALAFLVFFIAAILAGKTAAADRFRGNMGRWLNIAWTAVIAIVVIGALMRSYHQPRPALELIPAQGAEAANG